ncbi:MAG: carbohydrate ABC transporter permease [Aristaeellaceae bacterium]
METVNPAATPPAPKGKKVRPSIRYDRGEVITAYIFLLPLLVGVVLFFIIPIVQTLGYSFTKYKGLGTPEWIGMSNFVKLFTKDKKFTYELRNTFSFVLGTVPVTLAISMVLASLLNQRIRGRSFFRTVLFLPNVTMTVVVAMVWQWLLNAEYGIINAALRALFGISPRWFSDTSLTMFSMCLIAVWQGCGYCIVILLAGLQNISPTYYEAARIDGANSIQQFLRITVPLLTPTIFFLLVTRVIAAFNQFDLVYMIASTPGPVQNSLRTLVLGIYQSGFSDFAMGYACAKATILFIIIMIVTFLQMIGEKHWVNY